LPIWHLETSDTESPQDTADWERVAAGTRAWAAEHLPGVDTRATAELVAEQQGSVVS
jgi:hypothetical protein